MLVSIADRALRRIVHKLRSDAHIAEVFAQRQRRMQDDVARAYHEGEAAGLMQAVAVLEAHVAQDAAPDAAAR
jgi:hypothetical protein